MKRIILKMGVLGVFCLVAGCSDDGSSSPLQPIADDEAEVTSSSTAGESKTSSSAAPNTDKSSSESKGNESGTKDTTVIHEQVIITDSGAVKTSPYYSSSPVFCWTPGCEEKYSAAEPPKSSSSESIVFTESSASNDPPTVEGNSLKDNRDGKTYKLQSVAGKLWMAQDLNYETGGSMCFNSEDSKCETYGRLYTFAAASRGCPSGWRLPNRDEAQAVISDESFPWSYSGRCKTGECNFTGDMGFHWTSATAQEGDKKYGENSGDKFAVIIVEKHPDYDSNDSTRRFFQVDEKEKFFSVRCVQE